MLLVFILHNNYTLCRDFYLTHFLDADGAGEILLGQELARQGKWVVTQTWYYSREVRILHNQLVFGLLFRLFSDPLFVHLVGSTLIAGLMACAGCFALRSAKQPWWVSILGGTMLVTPFSTVIYETTLVNCYYSFFIICSFVFIGFMLRLAASQKTPRAMAIGMALYSLVLGFCGIRYVLLVFLPFLLVFFLLCLADINRSSKTDTLRRARLKEMCAQYPYRPALWMLLFTAVFLLGLVCSELVFANIFEVQKTSESLRVFGTETLYNSYRDIGWYWLLVMGETVLVSAGSAGGILAFLHICFGFFVLGANTYILARFKRYSCVEQLYIFFAFTSFAVSTFIVATANIQSANSERFYYLGMYCFLTLPVLLLARWQGKPARATLALMLGVGMAVAPMHMRASLESTGNYNRNRYIQETVAFLQDNGYTHGYATFWQANVITVLTNGEMQVTPIGVYSDGVAVGGWLHSRDAAEVDYTQDAYFMIVERESVASWPAVFEEYEEIYEYDDILVYSVPAGIAGPPRYWQNE